jgi:hypothetical protein
MLDKLREAIPIRARWLICLLTAMAGVLAATVGFGLTGSLQASPHSGKAHHTSSTSASTTAATSETKAYSGGRLMAADPSGGYWTVNWVGAVTAYGGAPTFGSPALSGIKPAKPIVDIAATPDGEGYWLVGSDGGVFAYGDAQFYGSTGALHLNQPIVGMATTPDGQGYWLVASDGGIFTFGDAQFYGSTGALHLNEPIVGMSATPTGDGYWLVASDGGIFTFGDAQFYGSTGALHLYKPIVGMAPTADGAGYWLVASDGGIFTYGDAKFAGSLSSTRMTVTGIVVNPSTGGYTLVELNGTAVAPTLIPVAAGVTGTSSSGTPSSGTSSSGSSPSGGTSPSGGSGGSGSSSGGGSGGTTTTTTTTSPGPGTASGNGTLPIAPSSLNAPTNLVLDDEFDTGSLNTTLWSPTWYGNTVQQNQTTMSASNVSVDGNGLELTAAANSTGGIVSSNPADDQPGHTGFQIAPTPGKPVYVEFKADLPAAANGEIANWPALWLVGAAPWPENGEIDVMEGLGGYAAYHLHFGNGNGEGADGPGQPVNSSPGWHTYGVLWTTTSITFVYDGVAVGTLDQSLTSPMHLVMENSIGSYLVTLPTTMTVRYVRVWQ